MSESRRCWYIYLIRCGDGSLYTGITTDVSRRLAEHRDTDGKGKGAKSLRGKQPLTIAFSTTVGSRSAALKIEYAIKQLGKADKEALLSQQLDLDTLKSLSQSDE